MNSSYEAHSSIEDYDLVILGSGEGSKYLGWTFAKRGERVAVIDRKIHRRVLSEHSLPTKQKHHTQC